MLKLDTSDGYDTSKNNNNNNNKKQQSKNNNLYSSLTYVLRSFCNNTSTTQRCGGRSERSTLSEPASNN